MGASKRPVVTERVVARVGRRGTSNVLPAELTVLSCTLMPHGAPATYQGARYAAVRLAGGKVVTVAIRKAELAAVVAGLQEVARELGVETGAGTDASG